MNNQLQELLKLTTVKLGYLDIFLNFLIICNYIYRKKIKKGIEPLLQDLQSNTLPLCYLILKVSKMGFIRVELILLPL